MYNIIINSSCNLSCDYCFADDYMKKANDDNDTKKNMDLATFKQVLTYLQTSGAEYASLMGGEPTLHPDFQNFWKLAKDFNFHFSLKTNALWNPEMLKFFNEHQDDLYSFHLNVNHPKTLTAKQWDIIKFNVLNLKAKGTRIQLNIDKPDFDYQWLLDLALEANIKEVYWSLTAPIASDGESKNTFASQSLHRSEYSKRLEEFLSTAHDMGFITTGIHGPTPCLVSRELYEKMKLRGSEIDGKCLPVFDIFPDKTVHYCFPLKGILSTPTIENVSSLNKIATSFIRESMVLRSLSFPWDDCVTCPEALSGHCDGGCLAQKKLLSRKLEDAWNYFDVTVPKLTNETRIAEEFFFWKGRPQNISNDEFLLLKYTNGNLTLKDIFALIYPDYVNALTDTKRRDSFSWMVADGVRKGWLILKPHSAIEIELR